MCMATKLGRVVMYHEGFQPIKLWLRVLSKSRDKLKVLYLHYHSAYGRQNWQSGDLPWGAYTYRVA